LVNGFFSLSKGDRHKAHPSKKPLLCPFSCLCYKLNVVAATIAPYTEYIRVAATVAMTVSETIAGAN